MACQVLDCGWMIVGKVVPLQGNKPRSVVEAIRKTES